MIIYTYLFFSIAVSTTSLSISRAYILCLQLYALHLPLAQNRTVKLRAASRLQSIMDASSSEGVNQSGRIQKWVLRVPVDCEGCRKKVTKILHSISGVESCDVDIKQQRVVVTGNVDAGTLIAKLVKKTGKHAELWPEPKVQKKKKTKEKPRRESDEAQSGHAEEQRGRADESPTTHVDMESAEEGEELNKVGVTEDGLPEDDDNKKKKNAAEGLAPAVNPPPHAAARGVEILAKKKASDVNKKKSKGQIGNDKIQHPVEIPPVDHNHSPPPSNNIPPRRQNPTISTPVNGQPPPSLHVPPRRQYQSMSPQPNDTTASSAQPPANAAPPSHPAPRPSPYYPQSSWSAAQPPPNAAPPRSSHFYPHPQPVYTVSYNAAPQPQSSRSAYVYRGSGAYDPRPASNGYYWQDDQVDYDAYGYRQQPESFGLFSDENPNACFIM